MKRPRADDPETMVALRGEGWYWLGWLPLAATYALAFGASGEPVHQAVVYALTNSVPMAVLGRAVLWRARRLTWTPARPARFFALHAGQSLLYTTACVAIIFSEYQLYWRLSGRAEVDYHVPVLYWQAFLALVAYSVVVSLHYAVDGVRRLQGERDRVAEIRVLQAQAELRALRAQINPHFLFNTLQSLLSLVRSDPDAAELALEQFGELLHYALQLQREGEDLVPLQREWDFVRNYLALEQLRLGDRLRLTTRLDPGCRECPIPAFTLQPLVENAIVHAIAPRALGGALEVVAGPRGDGVELTVTDDGPGATSGALAGDPGHGLALVRQRLTALYGATASVTEGKAPGGGLRIVVRLPCEPPWDGHGETPP